MQYDQFQQAVLARDMIDMARDYERDTDVLEYVSRMCFTLFMLFEKDPNHTIDWHGIYRVYDQKYYDLKADGSTTADEASIEKIYTKAIQIIESHSKTEAEGYHGPA